MTTTQHTPGPWYCIRGAIYADPNGQIPIAEMVRDDSARMIRPYVRDNNAHLMAQSPAMYEALKLCVEYINGLDTIPCINKAMKIAGMARQVLAEVDKE